MNTVINNYLKINYIYLLIIFCSFKFFGYSIGFIFMIPFIFYYKKLITQKIKSLNTENKLVFFYFSYLIFQSYIGAIAIRDYRVVIYWLIFFLVTINIYIINNYKLEYDKKYRINFQGKLYKSSCIYFVVFFIINLLSFALYGNEYDIQNNFWVGGSTSFNISSIFLYILFYRWSKISFKLKSWFSLSITSYIFLIVLNNSRLGQLYLLLFLLFTFLQSLKIKKWINGFLIISLCLLTYSVSYEAIYNLKSSINSNINYVISSPIKEAKNNIKNLLAIPNDLTDNKLSSSDTNRAIELKIGLEKFKSLKMKEKLLGTGWYSSRITINNIRNQMIDKLNLEKQGFTKNKINHLQGIVSLLLDTGLFGFILTILLFGLNIKNIITFKSGFLNKSFYLSLIFTNFFCLFIGYPWINIPFLLIFLPGGIFFLEK